MMDMNNGYGWLMMHTDMDVGVDTSDE